MSEETVQSAIDIEAQAQATADAADDYNPENVDILRDAAHIRARPGMYIGDTGSKGLHHLVYELVYNSVDEALAGYCHNIHVKINDDGSLSVTDDGRGIPVDIHPKVGRPTLEVVLTTVGAGAKFDYDTLENRLRELAFLNKGTAIKLSDALAGKEDTFAYKGGVAEFVEWLNRTEETFHKTLYVDKTVDDVRVEIAFQYTTGD